MKRLLPLLLVLAGCAEPEEPQPSVAGPAELVAPSAAGMDSQVAALVDDGWNDLQDALAVADADANAQAEAYAAFGLLCFGNGLTDTAEAAFEHAIDQVPDDARWIYFLALVRQLTGELDPAAAGFEQVLALDAGQFAAAIRLGDVRFEQADFAGARDAYEIAASSEDYRAAAHYGLGRVADALGDYAAAIENYEQALELQPNADRIHYLLGLAWRNQGDLEKAQTHLAGYGTAEPAFPDPLFDEISGGEAQIGGLWANMNAGSQAFVDGDFALAVEKFEQATVDHPDDPRSWESLGMAQRRSGELSAAAAAYQEAVRLSPQNGDLAITHAEVLVELGEDTMALEALKRAATANADDATVRMALGVMLSQTGDHSAAIEEITAASASAPDDDVRARAEFSLGRAYVAAGDNAAAIAAFSEAIDANADHGGARLELARTHVRSRQFDMALASYKTYLQTFERNDDARIEAATTAIFLNDVAEARSLLEHGVSSGEASPRQLSTLARLLVLVTDPAVRDPQMALQHANDALQASGARQHAETLALCLAALGRFDDAVRVQSQVLADAEQQGATAVRDRAARNLEAYRARTMGRLPLDAG